MRPLVETFAVRVYYEDTDLSGHLYHASYLRFLERGRTEWLRRLGLSHREIAGGSGAIFAVSRLQIEYLAPAQMDDLLVVETQISAFRGASIEFKQRLFRGLAIATVLVATIRDGRPARIPNNLRHLFEASSLTRPDLKSRVSKTRSDRAANESKHSPHRSSGS